MLLLEFILTSIVYPVFVLISLPIRILLGELSFSVLDAVLP